MAFEVLRINISLRPVWKLHLFPHTRDVFHLFFKWFCIGNFEESLKSFDIIHGLFLAWRRLWSWVGLCFRSLLEVEVYVWVGEFDKVEIELEFLIKFLKTLWGLLASVFLKNFVHPCGDNGLFVLWDLLEWLRNRL